MGERLSARSAPSPAPGCSLRASGTPLLGFLAGSEPPEAGSHRAPSHAGQPASHYNPLHQKCAEGPWGDRTGPNGPPRCPLEVPHVATGTRMKTLHVVDTQDRHVETRPGQPCWGQVEDSARDHPLLPLPAPNSVRQPCWTLGGGTLPRQSPHPGCSRPPSPAPITLGPGARRPGTAPCPSSPPKLGKWAAPAQPFLPVETTVRLPPPLAGPLLPREGMCCAPNFSDRSFPDLLTSPRGQQIKVRFYLIYFILFFKILFIYLTERERT